MKTYLPPKFQVIRDPDRCIQCQVCINQCSFDTHHYDDQSDEIMSDQEKCVGCHRCMTFCPTQAITITERPLDYRSNYNWRPEAIEDLIKQAETGGRQFMGSV